MLSVKVAAIGAVLVFGVAFFGAHMGTSTRTLFRSLRMHDDEGSEDSSTNFGTSTLGPTESLSQTSIESRITAHALPAARVMNHFNDIHDIIHNIIFKLSSTKETTKKEAGACVVTDRFVRMWERAPDGTDCNLDDQHSTDKGRCMDGFGPLGWCYTSYPTWGVCAEGCPLPSTEHKTAEEILAQWREKASNKKIEELYERQIQTKQAEASKVPLTFASMLREYAQRLQSLHAALPSARIKEKETLAVAVKEGVFHNVRNVIHKKEFWKPWQLAQLQVTKMEEEIKALETKVQWVLNKKYQIKFHIGTEQDHIDVILAPLYYMLVVKGLEPVTKEMPMDARSGSLQGFLNLVFDDLGLQEDKAKLDIGKDQQLSDVTEQTVIPVKKASGITAI